MNSVITIEGFDESRINECGTMFLGNDRKRGEMLQQAKNVGIYDLLNVPIVMLMVCTVFFEKKSLPKTRTEIVGTIFRLAMDRSTLKTFGTRSEEVRELDNLLYILGEISWSCLQKDVQQLLIFKVSIQFALLSSLKEYLKYFQRDFFGNSFDFFMKQDDVEEQSPDILKLGLLFEAGVDVATLGTAVTYLCFQHKLLQEYSGSYYITKSLEKTTDIKVAIYGLFSASFNHAF